MASLINPRWRLTVGTLDVSEHDIAFRVERSLGHSPGTAEIKIWNLADPSPIRRGQTVALRAGFEGDGDPPPTIFVGDVREAVTREDDQDIETTITARDGGELYFLARSSRSYAPGTPVSTAVHDLAEDLGVGLGNLGSHTFRLRNGADTFPDGWAFSGTARAGLDTLVRGCGLRWSIQHGALQVIARGRSLTEQVVYLSPSTGLIEANPAEATGEHAARSRGKITARCLLQPGLEPGRRVHVSGRQVEGEFAIHKLVVTGDTSGSSWECELECRAPVVD